MRAMSKHREQMDVAEAVLQRAPEPGTQPGDEPFGDGRDGAPTLRAAAMWMVASATLLLLPRQYVAVGLCVTIAVVLALASKLASRRASR